MIEGIAATNRLLKTVDLGIQKNSSHLESLKFEDMMEFSPEGLAAAETANAHYSDMQTALGPLRSLLEEALNEQASLSEGMQQGIQSKAQELLEGYFSAENTADRIFGFAFSFFDGNQDRTEFAEEMRGYINEGFAQAEKMLGALADISYETKGLIDERIDSFINSGVEEQA